MKAGRRALRPARRNRAAMGAGGADRHAMGFDGRKAANHARRLATYPGWLDIPAVLENRVYAVNASAYFARPGPRAVDGTELLAHLIHPEFFGWHGPLHAFQTVN